MWKKLFCLALLFLVINYFFDLGFFKGEITKYALSCDREKYVSYDCINKWLPLNPSTYKPDVSKQHVIYWSHAVSNIETLTKCSVVDRKNWTCKYDDESAEFGFKDGHYWETSLQKSATDYLMEFKYVSKLEYRLAEMKWW